jgi:hypothetical protein
LGRYIPGKKVVWSTKVTDEHGTVLQLTQESGVSKGDVADKEQQPNGPEHSEDTQVVDSEERPAGDQMATEEGKQTQGKSRRKNKFSRSEGVKVTQQEVTGEESKGQQVKPAAKCWRREPQTFY